MSGLSRRNFCVGVAAGAAGLAGGAGAQVAGVAARAADTPGPRPLTIESVRVASMLSPEVKATLRKLHVRQAMTDAYCLMNYQDQGYRAEPQLIPRATFQRSSVLRGSREHGNYQHHTQIARFHGRYFIAWSNGLMDEEAPGQQILVANSEDGLSWSDPVSAVPRQAEASLVNNCAGLLATDSELLLYCWRETAIHDAQAPGMRRIEAGSKWVDLYMSTDGLRWTLKTVHLLDPGSDHAPMFEAPRRTRDGLLLCGGSQSGPVVFLWPGSPTEPPEVIRVPPAPEASFPYGEATWYQTRDGLLVMFWRDEAQSMRLYVNSSADGGRTWTVPIPSDIPNSMQRVYAGNLPDGRAYLLNDANPRLLDRRQLTLALSDDGLTFDRIFLLVDDPVRQRFPGLLKVHGWQYPCALVDADRLLTAYSVNKEDIECGSLDLSTL